jgi:hypothetical protein
MQKTMSVSKALTDVALHWRAGFGQNPIFHDTA